MAGKHLQVKQKKRHILPIGLLLLLIVLFTGGIGTVAARYIFSDGGFALFSAKEFYFSSDLLAAEKPEYILNSNVRSVTFALKGEADDFRVTEVDINYTVKVNGEEVQKDVISVASPEVTVILNDLEPGKTYEVEAIGKAGYRKTLKAKFTISDAAEDVYYNLDVSRDGYMILTVWTLNAEGQVTVKFPAELIPDNTNVDMTSVYNVDGGAADFTGDFDKYSSKTYRFFYNEGNYTAADFKVTASNGSTNYVPKIAELP